MYNPGSLKKLSCVDAWLLNHFSEYDDAGNTMLKKIVILAASAVIWQPLRQ